MTARKEQITAFLRTTDWANAEWHPLPGDASTRRYIRLYRQGRTAMLMDQPQHAEAPTASADASAAERARLGYNALARLAGADCRRFAAAADYLRRAGLSAPDIYAADYAQGLLLLEDFGDALFAKAVEDGADEGQLYGAAVDALALLHTKPAPEELAPGIPLFAYDETALLAETALFTEWFWPMAKGAPIDASLAEEHSALWRGALKALDGVPRVFVHRDYHAQNLLWLPQRGNAGYARAGLIDFQDAVAGTPAYDLISLTEDVRRDVSPELGAALLQRYFLRMTEYGLPADEERFRALAALLAAQRNTKIVGIFARLAGRDGKTRYLNYMPRVWRLLERDLTHPSLRDLKAWYDRHIPSEIRYTPIGVTA
jgi:aminoglycoside/choline kinase family phosphotransferase